MREKLKSLNIRLTELSDYLGFSRPTLYKYLEDYENKKFKSIDFRVRKVFDYILKKKTLSKIEVINFIIDLNKLGEESILDELYNMILQDEYLLNNIISRIDNEGISEVFKKIKNLFIEGDVKND